MARAGRALKRVLESYGISQNQLATTMGIDRSNVSRWVSGSRDPSAEAVAEIKKALSILEPQAAEEFVRYYLYEELPEELTSDSGADIFPEMLMGTDTTSSITDQSPRLEASIAGFTSSESYLQI